MGKIKLGRRIKENHIMKKIASAGFVKKKFFFLFSLAKLFSHPLNRKADKPIGNADCPYILPTRSDYFER